MEVEVAAVTVAAALAVADGITSAQSSIRAFNHNSDGRTNLSIQYQVESSEH